MLFDILTDSSLHGILIDVGLPIMHRGCRFNSRAIILDGKILCLRPKIYLANDGYVYPLLPNWGRESGHSPFPLIDPLFNPQK